MARKVRYKTGVNLSNTPEVSIVPKEFNTNAYGDTYAKVLCVWHTKLGVFDKSMHILKVRVSSDGEPYIRLRHHGYDLKVRLAV